MNNAREFWDAVDALRARSTRYSREAYGFVATALEATVLELPPSRREDASARHLSGGELLTGVVRLARQEFGGLAPMVFREWGVRSGEDVGEIVFELVRCGQLSARPEDTLEDFRVGRDLMRELSPEAPGPHAPGGAAGRPA